MKGVIKQVVDSILWWLVDEYTDLRRSIGETLTF